MGTRRIQIGCEFVYQAEIDTPAVFHVRPIGSAEITVEDERWLSKPHMAVRDYTDLYGNPGIRAILPAGRSSFGYEAVAKVPDATEDADQDAPERLPDEVPDDTLIYTMPSRYCLSDVLADEAWARFGGLTPGYGRVQAICDYVHNHLAFQYGSSTPLRLRVPARP
jgi:transglutaminase-like putative cysteine protease